MKALLTTLIFSLLASTPCLLMAEEQNDKSFPVQMEQWHVVRGDTLSQIAQKLLPDNIELREQLMYKILELNPIVFPTNDIDFMLAFNTLFFPTHIGNINIKHLVAKSVNSDESKEAEFVGISSLEEDAIAVTELDVKKSLYVAPNELKTLNIKSDTGKINNRFYSVSASNVEQNFVSGSNALNNYQYITEGENTGLITIENGPLYKLEINTRIKVYTNLTNQQSHCQINLIYGLIRVQEKTNDVRHCIIQTSIAKISASRSDYAVRVCNDDNCIINTQVDKKARLPAGVYYGVVKGKIAVTDKSTTYYLKAGDLQYYSFNNKKPRGLKHFNGLLFRIADLSAIKKNKGQKNHFAWGSIQKHSQDPDYIDPKDDIRTDFVFDDKIKKKNKKTKMPLIAPDNNDSSSTLDRFN